jgi:tyrosyl-tRNA synthetase
MTPKEKLKIIKRNLQEILGEEELDNIINNKKPIKVYWGTMPTGSISIAYFFPMLKIADFLKANCKVKILNADIHAALDSVPWPILEKRFLYYKEAITNILNFLNVDIKKLEFVKGSNIQLQPKYFEDLLKLSTLTSVKEATKAASEAVKTAQGDNVKLSGLIYPLMQALDEQYLDVDVQFAGLDQRKILVFAREFLPKIGYKPRIELMTPMIRGLVGEKMSSSIESTKIDLLNTPKEVIRKIKNADFATGNSDNGVMSLLKHFIFVLKSDKKETLIIERPEKFGGNLQFSNYQDLEKQFLENKIHPLDIKNSLAKEINLILRKIQTPKLKKLHKEAYS